MAFPGNLLFLLLTMLTRVSAFGNWRVLPTTAQRPMAAATRCLIVVNSFDAGACVPDSPATRSPNPANVPQKAACASRMWQMLSHLSGSIQPAACQELPVRRCVPEIWLICPSSEALGQFCRPHYRCFSCRGRNGCTCSRRSTGTRGLRAVVRRALAISRFLRHPHPSLSGRRP